MPLPRRGGLSLDRQRKEPKKAGPDGSAAARVRVPARGAPMAIPGLRRVSAISACASCTGRIARPATSCCGRSAAVAASPLALTLRAFPAQSRRCRRGLNIKSARAARAVAFDVAFDVRSVGQSRAAQPGARERRACSSPWMGEFALGAAHALRARARKARAGLGREAGCESGQGDRRAAQGETSRWRPASRQVARRRAPEAGAEGSVTCVAQDARS